MLKTLNKTAHIVRDKYLLEIDGCVNTSDVFKAKFLKDREYWRYICNILYRKIKK